MAEFARRGRPGCRRPLALLCTHTPHAHAFPRGESEEQSFRLSLGARVARAGARLCERGATKKLTAREPPLRPRAPPSFSPFPQATLPLPALAARLAAAGAAATLLLSGPIAAASFEPSTQPLEWAAAAGVGGFGVMTALAARIAGGWSYVGARLLSAAVPYEETGWYDGQTFVKPPEVLARDRLLGTYEVREREGETERQRERRRGPRPARAFFFSPKNPHLFSLSVFLSPLFFLSRSAPPSPA